MRHQGRIASWNPQRGFGFIKQDQGGADLFVHITALQFDGRLPEVGERVSYQVESGKDDKPCAVQVFFPDRPLSLADGLRPSIESPMPDRGNRADVNMRAPQPAMPRARVHHAPRRKGNWRGKLVPLLVLAGLVIWKGEPALARMRKGTPILLRFSLWLLVVGAFARLVWIFLGNVPDPVTLLMLGGVSAMLLCERRVSVLTRGRLAKGLPPS